jgi:hypothetical protein
VTRHLSESDRGLDDIVIIHGAWLEKFRPRQNLLSAQARWGGLLYEPYGVDLEAVHAERDARPDTIWTLTSGANGDRYIGRGFHTKDVVGYFICAVAWSEGDEYIVMKDAD